MESSAINILKRAVALETDGRCTEALVCYQEGIQLLLDVLKGIIFYISAVNNARQVLVRWTGNK